MRVNMNISDLLQGQADFNEYARDMLRGLEGSCNHPVFLEALYAMYSPPHFMPVIGQHIELVIGEMMIDAENEDPARVVTTLSARTLISYLRCALFFTHVISTIGPEQEEWVGKLSNEFVTAHMMRAAQDAVIHRTLIANRIQNMATDGSVKWGTHGLN